MGLTPAAIALIGTTFVASAVEVVEAFTIVLAMGLTRSWRSAIIGTLTAFVALAVITAVIGVTLKDLVSESVLQLVIGTLLLIFGLQWLRKAILRSSGLKALHDEDETFREEQAAAQAAGRDTRMGLDWFAFVVSFKGVFLEGLEVVFIVITFGLAAMNSDTARVENGMLFAAAGALLAAVVVLVAGAIAHKPLSSVPENTMKFAVGLLLATFGTYWTAEGIGYFSPTHDSLHWYGAGDIPWPILGIFIAWLILSRIAVSGLRQLPAARKTLAMRAAGAVA
jgi:Ca2+/H+ antiporter, TMEM165/GDT1 family